MWQLHQRTVSVLGASLAVLVGMLLADPSVAGAATGCRAVDTRDGAVHHRLQRAINHAASGDTLLVQGTCVGSFVVNGKDLTLRGVTGDGAHRATLDGGGAGSVVSVFVTDVVLDNLIVQHGFAHQGAGIENQDGTVTLNHTLVRRNRAETSGVGGGIDSFGTVILDHHSVVRRNAAGLGGGIYVSGDLVMRNSAVSRNRAYAAGGIGTESSDLYLTNSVVSGNRARVNAGGIDLDGEFLVLAGTTTITGNTLTSTAFPGAGGLTARRDRTKVVAADGTSAYQDPITFATLPAWTGSVSGNIPNDCYAESDTIFTIACG